MTTSEQQHDPTKQPVSDAQAAVLRSLGGEDHEALAMLGVRDFAELPAVEFSRALRSLRA